MGTALYRLGRFAFRRHRQLGLLWLTTIIAVAGAAATLSGPASAAFSIPGTESQRAFDLLNDRFPELWAGGAAARVVFAAPDGERVTDPANAAAVERALDTIAAGPQVGFVLNPFGGQPLEAGLISDDATMALAEVTYTVDPTLLDERVRVVLSEAIDAARATGLIVESAGTATEATPEFGPELVGLLVAVVVLVLTFGSLTAAGMPLLTGIVGVCTAVLAITALMGVIEMSSFTPLLAIMIGLAVGIDYALFILSRYRDELRAGHDGEEAAGRALGTAGTAVVFAAFTVVVALAALSLNGISLLTEMGIAAAFTVVVALVVALTLLPALLGFAGRRAFSLRVPGLAGQPVGATRVAAATGTVDAAEASDRRPARSRRWIEFVVRRPGAVLAIAGVGLALLMVPVQQVRLGFIDEGSFPEETTQRRAFELIARGFGPGASGHLLVVVDATDSSDVDAAIRAVEGALATTDAQDVFPPQLDGAGTAALFVVIPTHGPASAETEQLVAAIRSDVAAAGSAAGATVVATGSTALQIDVTNLSAGAVAPYLAILVGLSLLALLLVFRSFLVPVMAAAGFLVTIAATFGVLVGVYQWGWLEAVGIRPVSAIISLLPLVIVGIAFGLAMDYQFFLVTRMREAYVRTRESRVAVVTGFGQSARVVTAAATIMIAVFGAFGAFNDAIEIAQIGMALAVAIAVDAFVVRMAIVPAGLAIAGDGAWWLPGWLERRIPDLDIEGRGLTRYLDGSRRRPDAVAKGGGAAG